MSVFDFEENIRDYSKKNAYWLGKASQIAYKPSGRLNLRLEAGD